MAIDTGAGRPVSPRRRASRRGVNLVGGREIDRALTALNWTSADARFTASLHVRSGTAVISMDGHLGRTSIAACRSALDAAIRIRPAHLIVDLEHACTDQDSAGLLALMVRSAARHGISIQLADAPATVRAQLSVLAPPGSYAVHQNLAVALRAVTGAARPVVT